MARSNGALSIICSAAVMGANGVVERLVARVCGLSRLAPVSLAEALSRCVERSVSARPDTASSTCTLLDTCATSRQSLSTRNVQKTAFLPRIGSMH